MNCNNFEITFRRSEKDMYGKIIKELPIIKVSLNFSKREMDCMYAIEKEYITEKIIDKLVDRIKERIKAE